MRRTTHALVLAMLALGCRTAARVEVQHRIDLATVWAPLTTDDLDDLPAMRSVCVGADGTVCLASPLGLLSFRLDERGQPGPARLLRAGEADRVGPLDVSPDGRRLVAGSIDSPSWDVLDLAAAPASPPATTRSRIEDAAAEDRGTWFAAWRTNDELLLWTTDGAVRAYDTTAKSARWTREAGSGSVACSPQRRFVIVPSVTPSESVVLRAADGEPVARFAIDPPESNLFGAVSDDGACAVVGRYAHDRFHVWEKGRDGVRTIQVPGSRRSEGAGMVFLPGSHRLLVYWPESIFLVDARSGRVLDWCDVAPSQGFDWGPSWTMRVTPDGRRCLLLTDSELIVLRIR